MPAAAAAAAECPEQEKLTITQCIALLSWV